MPDIIIRHCTLHIVRQGGWSWGEDPRALARKAAGALGRLLERRFAEMGPDGVDIEVVAPVRLTIAVQRAELAEASEEGFDGGRESALYERFRAAVEQAVARAVTAFPASKAPEPHRVARPDSRPAETLPTPLEKLLKLLTAWWRRGELEQVLCAVGDRTVEAWHRTILPIEQGRPVGGTVSSPIETAGAPGRVESERMPDRLMTPAVIAALVRAATAGLLTTRVDVMRARIIAAVAAIVESGAGAIGPAFAAALDRVLPLPLATPVTDLPLATPVTYSARSDAPESNPALPETTAGPTRSSRAPRPIDAPPTVAATPGAVFRRPPARFPAKGGLAQSALPFLMLGALSKMGYFDALDAVLSAAELSEEAALFASALAYKVIDPPERGWRRAPAAITTAAIFAGLDEPASNEALAEFARRAADFLPVLDRVIADALASGHQEGSPLLLCEAPACGWLLAEVDGVFPIEWSDSPDGLLETVKRFGRPRLLVPIASAGGGLLARLDGAGFLFLTDAPPGRGESWKPIRRLPHERWWTNDADAPAGSLVASGRKLGPGVEALEESWRELAVNRRAIAPGDGGSLETSLALASAVALADLSWNLWNDADDTDPLLAMERFATLDARVRVRPDEVLVKLPLGKRSMDLSSHGLLVDVAGVP
ncbi:MAG TPA: hypothetical protein VJ376_01255, partial [Pseudomonadota bacterium]|nr:hypothetical protein [Pseudomonadota bacterium]